jgi:Tfp pilus assembly protein PilX
VGATLLLILIVVVVVAFTAVGPASSAMTNRDREQVVLGAAAARWS